MGQRQSAVEGLVMTPSFWKDRSVLITGHTGFKGSWLAALLYSWGAKVSGLALPPDEFSLFQILQLDKKISSHFGDIRDQQVVDRVLSQEKPEIVLHLAAQALVRPSYQDPVGTYATNVMGTIHVLEAVRRTSSVKTCLVVTSDKCYENRETNHAYIETDAMGGWDPYSSSKGCAELVTASWYRSFWQDDSDRGLCSARAGNVIGGGDFAVDRLIPDCVRAFEKSQKVVLRFPHSTRPWQHVLEPLSGYVTLAEKNYAQPKVFAGGWNFGPGEDQELTVETVVHAACKGWGDGAQYEVQSAAHVHEAKLLKLDCSKAKSQLHWHPRLNFTQTMDWTMQWYKAYSQRDKSSLEAGFDSVSALTFKQIQDYSNLGVS